MIKSKHKIISIVLCVALVLTALFALTFSANAASGDTVYVRIPSSWSSAYCYMWNDNGNNGQWPGVAMTATSESGVYSYKVTGDYNNIIFNNGNSGVGTNQTTDMTYANYNGYICDLTSDITNGSWSQYAQVPTQGGGDNTQPTQATQPTAHSGSGITVYLKNTKGWSAPNCYMWNGNGGAGNENNAWPGKPMTKVSDDVWSYTDSTVYTNVIFNGSDQTGNLTAKDGYIYDPSSDSWEVYDLSPLQVKSYSADPDSNIYTGMEVTFTASAASTEGDVYYKFSVNNTTVRDFTTGNTATWTPTAAGTYTVTFDFKDNAGNTNTRSLTLDVASDSGVTAPIIKTVSPAAEAYVKTGSAVTVNVGAGGGKTGTNLLFYKYVVVDPSGKQNTPYYTLNASYSFTPYSEGKYTVSVFVQASDNVTVTKTFTLNATGGDIPTQPTEATLPTVKPTEATQPTVMPTEATQPTQATQPTTPSGYQRGDVNMDKTINVMDVTHIQKYLAEYSGYNVTLALGDMNLDNRISIKDVTALQRYIVDNMG